MDKYAEIRVPIASDNPSIRRKNNKCVLCGKCKDVCKKQMGVAGYWEYNSEDIVCINCGQCANVCPVNAIVETEDSEALMQAIQNPNKKVVIITAPAVRASLGETFDMEPGECVTGKMVSALRALGADYVFDVTYGADLTIMEEASELLDRIKNNKTMPMFTSCCPAWVKFVETFYPQNIPNLSTCKSPISMQASVIRNYFAKNEGLKPEDLYVVAVVPCVAKKFEIKREELSGIYGQDTDLAISVRELGRLLKKQKINLSKQKEGSFDSALPMGTGAGVIFGASGGVMEACVRTAHYFATGEALHQDALKFKKMRGYKSVKTATINLLGRELKLCVVFGTINARDILNKLKSKKIDMLEVMACPNGCVGGGGQPIPKDNDQAVVKRADCLFKEDEKLELKASYQNAEIQKMYKEFMQTPLSDKAEKYLHTEYKKR